MARRGTFFPSNLVPYSLTLTITTRWRYAVINEQLQARFYSLVERHCESKQSLNTRGRCPPHGSHMQAISVYLPDCVHMRVRVLPSLSHHFLCQGVCCHGALETIRLSASASGLCNVTQSLVCRAC